MKHLLLMLEFNGAVRIGVPGRDDQSAREWIAADQLFSWISLGWIQLFGKSDFSDCVLQPIRDQKNPWIHTDAFPYAEESIWFPTPKWNFGRNVSSEDVTKKGYRSWVKWDTFVDTVFGDRSLKKEDTAAPITSVMLSNVTIGANIARKNSLYHTAATLSAATSKNKCVSTTFAAIISCYENSIEEKLRLVCNFMAPFGLGGGRSSGLGTIRKASIEPFPTNMRIPCRPAKKGFFVILSPCCPTSTMLQQLEESASGSNFYSISSRSGWIYTESGKATDIRKPSVRSFDTGSIFSVEPAGQLIDVGTPEYPSFKYGIPYSLEV